MKQRQLIWSLMAGALIMLGGCGRIIDWAQGSLNQGRELDRPLSTAQCYLRSVVVYDQLETVGMFDALWLSNELRTAYAQLHSLKHGKQEVYHKVFLRRQLEENNHFITFYVLSLYNMPLSMRNNAVWTVVLRIGDQLYQPLEIAELDMTAEFKLFFADKVSKFKVPYSIKFAARDTDDNAILTSKVKDIELIFRSVNKETVLIWSIDANGKLVCRDGRHCCMREPDRVTNDQPIDQASHHKKKKKSCQIEKACKACTPSCSLNKASDVDTVSSAAPVSSRDSAPQAGAVHAVIDVRDTGDVTNTSVNGTLPDQEHTKEVVSDVDSVSANDNASITKKTGMQAHEAGL